RDRAGHRARPGFRHHQPRRFADDEPRRLDRTPREAPREDGDCRGGPGSGGGRRRHVGGRGQGATPARLRSEGAPRRGSGAVRRVVPDTRAARRAWRLGAWPGRPVLNIAVVGTGYVGLVTAACFAEFGVDVVAVDKDREKIAMLQKAKVPFFEPGLEEMVARNMREDRLVFSTEIKPAVETALVIIIAVGTPPG